MYNIEINPINFGYCCIFDAFDKTWYADICRTYSGYNECMIFLYDKEHNQVANWRDVYCKRGLKVSEKSLISCIEEFKKTGPYEWDNPQRLDIPDDMEEEYPDNINEDAQQQSEEELP